LAIGTASTPVLLPEHVGRKSQVYATAIAVREAIKRAAIADDADVPLGPGQVSAADQGAHSRGPARGEITATDDPYTSMALTRSRGVRVAVALGEVDSASLDDRGIGRDFSLWSSCASASVGVELMHNQVIVLGNSSGWSGDNIIAHIVMRDAIDLSSANPKILARHWSMPRGAGWPSRRSRRHCSRGLFPVTSAAF
jgi:cyanuric acid amidohydrolase